MRWWFARQPESRASRWAWVKRLPTSWPQHVRVIEGRNIVTGILRRSIEPASNAAGVWWAWRTQPRRSSLRDWSVRRGTLLFRGVKLFDWHPYDLGDKYPESVRLSPVTARRLAAKYPLRARTQEELWAEFQRDVEARYTRWAAVAQQFVDLVNAGDPMSLRVVAAESRQLGRRLRLGELPGMLFAPSRDALFNGGDRDAAMLQARLSYIPRHLRPRALRNI